MKPVSLCLVTMGKAGLELVDSYPKILSQEELNEIILKSMPLSAKDGDFTLNTVGVNSLSGYIFAVPGESRTNIASLIAVFSSMDYNPQIVKKIFSFTIMELRKNNLVDLKLLANILPELYKGLSEQLLKIKISSVITLEFDFRDTKAKPKDPTKEIEEDLKKNIWQ